MPHPASCSIFLIYSRHFLFQKNSNHPFAIAMDLHPTPFPGKRRPLGNPTIMKERDQPKPAVSHTQSKPKRAFGRNLSGNVTIERASQKPLASKPWKPSGVSINTQKPAKKVVSALSGAGGAKSGSNKKEHHVTFLETQPPAVEAAVDEFIEVSYDDLLLRTPVLMTDTSTQETPYQSAENCSKCRLDRLETSSYWISQVNLAEPTGRHFVAAAFFRLALECKAQPFVILQNELKHYRDRHGVVFMESLWDDLCRDYGLASEQPDANSLDADAVLVEQFGSKCSVKEERDVTDDRDMLIDYDIIDRPEDILEDLEAKHDLPEEINFGKQSEDGMLKLSSPMDSLLKNFQDVENPSSSSVLKGAVSRSVKIVQMKSKFGDLISRDSETDTRTKKKAIISSKKVGRAGTGNSGSEPAWKAKDESIIGSSNMLKSKRIAEEQCRSDHSDEKGNSVENREKVEEEDSEIFNQD